MRILVTGGNGQLASVIKQSGTFSNHTMFYASSDELNICDLSSVQAYASAVQPDAIINCAAFTDVDLCESEAQKAMAVNAVGARNVAMIAQQLNAKLIHLSTDYVFDGTATKPYAEWDIPNPQTVYGKSKLLGEQYVRDFCKRHFVVRTAWLYSDYGKNFVKTIQRLAKERDQIQVVDDQFGCPTYAGDLVKHLLRLIETEEYGLYHCTGNGQCSWYEFACKIVELSKLNCQVLPCKTDCLARPAKRPTYSKLANGMLCSTIGDEMPLWQETLEDFLR